MWSSAVHSSATLAVSLVDCKLTVSLRLKRLREWLRPNINPLLPPSPSPSPSPSLSPSSPLPDLLRVWVPPCAGSQVGDSRSSHTSPPEAVGAEMGWKKLCKSGDARAACKVSVSLENADESRMKLEMNSPLLWQDSVWRRSILSATSVSTFCVLSCSRALSLPSSEVFCKTCFALFFFLSFAGRRNLVEASLASPNRLWICALITSERSWRFIPSPSEFSSRSLLFPEDV